MACGEHKHPLQRGGASQADRFLAGLEPGYVRVDEKDLADWIVYAEELSASVKFFNLDNQAPVGSNWKPFFSSDISASLAFIAVQNREALDGIAARFTTLRADANQGNEALLTQTLGELFGAALTFAKSLDDLVARLPANAPLRLVTLNLIKTKLAKTIERLIAHFKAATGTLATGGSVPSWKILGLPVSDAQTIIDGSLSAAWIPAGGGTWTNYVSAIAADASIFGDSASNAQKIRHAANHNLFSSLFDQLLSSYARVLAEASKNLEATLGEWKEHSPHYTLFLAFLKLLKRVQAELNQFTGRHLGFYYRDVLRLRPKAPAPDSAFITVELAKTVPNYLLPKGTLFRAGKDSAAHDVFYSLQKDVVLNKAKLARLMSVYRGSARDNIDAITNSDRWFAAPVSNSVDGNGTALTTPQREWHPYVNRTFVDGELESINQPLAQIGFAIASHYLALADGRREIFVRLETSANSVLESVLFDLYFTGPKGWFEAPAPEISTATLDGTNWAILKVVLEPAAPSVVDYDPEIHGGTFGVTLPVIKILLRNDPSQSYQYEALRDIELTKVEMEVDVGSTSSTSFTAEGARQLLLGSGAGTIDPAKPFLPFGPQPESGATFVIGSREIFSKKGAQLRFNFEWLNPPDEGDIAFDDTSPPTVAVEFLEGGVWSGALDDLDLFGTTNTVAFPSEFIAVPEEALVLYDDPFEMYSNQTRTGFLRLRLNETFGHKEYLSNLTAYLIEQSKPTLPDPAMDKPTEPYQPTLQSFLISYKATATTDLTGTTEAEFVDRPIRFFHFYPFGEVEQHGQLGAESPIYLMPQFRYIETPLDTGAGGGAETSLVLKNQAEFYVGLESLAAGESVSILFQFLDGSSDPQTLKPDEHLFFSYLSNNSWKAIRRNLVADGTRQFIQSGLIEMAIPADATSTNTVLPAGYIWLRFSVAEAPDAIAKIINVLPQAALVTYQATPLNAPDFPAAPLPAGTIAKLKEPVSAIKKIQQPYPSFRLGGSGETEQLFYVRVSERLRHKDRAISIWSYEHLVLQAFPQIHRVKCLSHTSLVPDPAHPGELLCNELAPGQVLVITVPDLANRNDANPLRPYTNADLIAEIQEYLRARVSCHAHVVVANPLFEELRMEFTVTLRKGYTDAAFYRKQLQEEIAQFLTPWAFEDGKDIQFGGKVHKSSLIDFVEERDAVDFLMDVKLYHKPGDNAVESEDLDEVSASTARSILVSAPASKHAITVLLHDEEAALEEECCTDE